MADPRKYPQFFLLGDSVIQNAGLLRDGVSFGAALYEHCQRRLDVINRGLSGYNTANVMSVLPELFAPPSCNKIDYLLILFGANDACLPSSPTRQHVPIEKYRENLQAIINHPSVTAHSPTILLVTPPPINEYQVEENDLSKGYSAITRLANITAQYAAVVREIATENKDKNVVLIDLWTALMNAAIKLTPDHVEGSLMLGSRERSDSQALRHFLADGLHLTGAGYSVFLTEILSAVGKEWAQEPIDDPAWIFPHWSLAPRID